MIFQLLNGLKVFFKLFIYKKIHFVGILVLNYNLNRFLNLFLYVVLKIIDYHPMIPNVKYHKQVFRRLQ